MDESKEKNQLTKTGYGQVRQAPIVQEMERSYLDYAMSVIVSRALPDVRDGLKPVHRRILFAMKGLGLTKQAAYKKTARIVGEVLGKYHPHGDLAVYDALVRLAQDFSMRYPLVDGQGNFGSIDGDSPAAMRYTEARMERITAELLADLEKNTVGWMDNFDGTQKEPTVLPAKLPNLLLMGSDGIAVGMATKIPPHNLTEVCDALIMLIQKGESEVNRLTGQQETENNDKDDAKSRNLRSELVAVVRPSRARALSRASGDSERTNSPTSVAYLESADPKILIGEFDSEATLTDLLQHVKGPDFPTGGCIYDAKSLADTYATGRGSITTRGVAAIEESRGGRYQILITQLPYQVNKARLVAKIADLVKQKRIEGVADLRDESDREGLRIAVDLKRDAVPRAVLNQLYKYTELQTSFPANMVALTSSGVPQLMNLKTMLMEFVRHRQLVIARRSQFDLLAARDRAHILEGLLKAIDILDQVIATIRSSKDADVAKHHLMTKFGFTERQAVAILDMQLRKLAALERQKLTLEYASIKQAITELISLLSHPDKILGVIVNELTSLKETYGDPRRTKVIKGKIGEFSDLDLVPSEEVIVTITETGYIKRMPVTAYRSQRRGGKGVKGMETKQEDTISTILSANTHDDILFFTNVGKVYKLKVHELPSGGRLAKGQAIVNLLPLSQGEVIQSTLALETHVGQGRASLAELASIRRSGLASRRSESRRASLAESRRASGYFIAATKHGLLKKTPASNFANLKSNGLIAIDLRAGDEVKRVMQSQEHDRVLLITKGGKAIACRETDIRPTGRDTQGVRGILMGKGDELLSMTVLPKTIEVPHDRRRKVFQQLLVVTERGIGKRTAIAQYPTQRRGGQGVKVAVINKKTGNVAAALLVTEKDEYVVINTAHAQVIKLPLKNIPVLKRPTQGVILVRLSDRSDAVVSVATIEKEE